MQRQLTSDGTTQSVEKQYQQVALLLLGLQTRTWQCQSFGMLDARSHHQL